MAPKKEDPPATYLIPIHLEEDQIIIDIGQSKDENSLIPKPEHRTVVVHMQKGQLFFLLA